MEANWVAAIAVVVGLAYGFWEGRNFERRRADRAQQVSLGSATTRHLDDLRESIEALNRQARVAEATVNALRPRTVTVSPPHGASTNAVQDSIRRQAQRGL